MANQEHLKILKNGVNEFNAWYYAWHRKNKKIELDLTYADLSSVDLSYADLSGANLESANLENANLENAKLKLANLSYTILCRANFGGANLQKANLNGANLEDANLVQANINGANLEVAILEGANLQQANLNGANLKNANLNGANLERAKLEEASFGNVDLRRTNLIRVVFDGANLTGVKLWETQRAGWSLKNVICEYAYFDEKGEVKTEFAPGEFERLYSDKTKVVLHFKGGISPLEIATLPALIRHLETQHGRKLSLQSVNDDAGGATVILRIDDDEEIPFESRSEIKEQLQISGQEIIVKLRERNSYLEGQAVAFERAFEKALAAPKYQLIGGNMGDTYNNSGQAGAMGPNSQASNNQFIQNFGQQINLLELSKELGTIREKLKEEAKSTEEYIALAEVSKAEDAAKANNPSGVISSLKSGGSFLLDFAKKLGVSLAAHAIEEAMKG